MAELVPYPTSYEQGALSVASWRRFADRFPDPLLMADRRGELVFLNRAYLRWLEELGLPRPPTLGPALIHGGEDRDLLFDLWDTIGAGEVWTGKQRFRSARGEGRPARMSVSPVPDRPAGQELYLVHMVDLSGELEAAEVEASKARTNLLLDLLGLTLTELEAPVHALTWAAELRKEDLEHVPKELRHGLHEVRQACQRLTSLFLNVQAGARRAGVGEKREQFLIRALLAEAEPKQAVRVLDGLQRQGVRCLIRTVNSAEEALRAVRGGSVDAVLFGRGMDHDDTRRTVRSIHALQPAMPVFDLTSLPLDKLGRGLLEAVQRRLREDAEAAAWRRIEEIALRDPLTGVLNRRALERYGQVELSRAQRYGFSIALALFDLDHFKNVNDQCGHHFGDQLLDTFAAALQAGVRDSDLVARLGGDEFVVLMTHTDADGSRTLADRLRRTGDEVLKLFVPDQDPAPTVSVGLAVYPDQDVEDLGDLLRRADEALYRAKSAGRDQVAS